MQFAAAQVWNGLSERFGVPPLAVVADKQGGEETG
jgi:hypothetical protein